MTRTEQSPPAHQIAANAPIARKRGRVAGAVSAAALSVALLAGGCSGGSVGAEGVPVTSVTAEPTTAPDTQTATQSPSPTETTPTTVPTMSTSNPDTQPTDPNKILRHTIVQHFGSCAVMDFTNSHSALTNPVGGPWNTLTLEFNNELDQDSHSARQANLGSRTVAWTNPTVLGLEVNASGANGQRLGAIHIDSRNDPVTANIWNADLLVSTHPHDGDYLAVYLEDDATTAADHMTTRRADRCSGSVMQYSVANDRWNQIPDDSAPAALQPVFEQDSSS